MRTQGTQVAAEDDGVRVGDTDHVVNRITQGSACTLEYLEHRSLAFIDGLDDPPDRFLGSFVDQPSRLVSGQQIADSQQVLRPDQRLQAAVPTAVAGRPRRDRR